MKRPLLIPAMLIFLAGFVMKAFSQDLPATDIYLLTMKKDTKGKYVFGEPQRITSWEGYDNQPWFYPDGLSVLYTSVREDGRADVYRYTIADGKTIHEINTPLTSEYSPMQTADKLSISCVRVMEDDSTQLLYKFTGKEDNPEVIFPKQKGVGYYAWINNNLVVMYILGDTSALILGNATTKEVKPVTKNIGRCLQKVPNKELVSFVLIKDDGTNTICTFDYRTGKITPIVDLMQDSEDYCWMTDGTLLMGNGSKLYKFKPVIDKTWVEIGDFAGTPVEKFYRIAVTAKGDRIAVVTYPDERP